MAEFRLISSRNARVIVGLLTSISNKKKSNGVKSHNLRS